MGVLLDSQAGHVVTVARLQSYDWKTANYDLKELREGCKVTLGSIS
jgi:hypothetical protein